MVSFLSRIITNFLKNLTLILNDKTKIFISNFEWFLFSNISLLKKPPNAAISKTGQKDSKKI